MDRALEGESTKSTDQRNPGIGDTAAVICLWQLANEGCPQRTQVKLLWAGHRGVVTFEVHFTLNFAVNEVE